MRVRKYGVKKERERGREREEYTCVHDARRGRDVCDG